MVFPTSFSFPKVVRIISILYKFITAFKSKWSKAIVTTDAHPSPSPLLRLICPDQFRMGRISNRIPTGPFRLPDSPKDLIARVDELYWIWHSIFNDSMLPALLAQSQPKWFTQDTDLMEGDVVYFHKTTGAIKGPWSMGPCSLRILWLFVIQTS